MADNEWIDVGSAAALREKPVQEVTAGKLKLALSCVNGEFAAISGVCNHVGGPLGHGTLDGDFLVCPWHYWTYHRATGESQFGDSVPSHEVRIENDRVLVSAKPRTKRVRTHHEPHPLARPAIRAEGPVRVLGLSTTAMTAGRERYSTSEDLLERALAHAQSTLGCETQLIRVRDLEFRNCEGFYSKAARACTWPCSITLMDPADQMDRIYEGLVHWADVVLLATPIRWGSASSLYFKMIERMNCIQNQETIANKHLLHNKVAAFIITGGQDNVQATAGQMLTFFAELGCQFPQYPFIAHSRGWSAEDMENNMAYVRESKHLEEGAKALVQRAVEMAALSVAGAITAQTPTRGGRKGHELDTRAQLLVQIQP
ncbi:MAG: Rieske 2Fe-2S domain-containing protein [Acidobacteria bacterium]|nr:Rieske 2Fe-2S domain-containing protein [Acidobacteriota bacterium]